MGITRRLGAAGLVSAIGLGGAMAPPAGARTTVKASGTAASTTVCGVQRRAVTVDRGATVRLRVVRSGASRRSRKAVTVRIATCRDGRFVSAVRRKVATSRKLGTATAGDFRITLNGRSIFVHVRGAAAPTPTAPAPARSGIRKVRTTDGSVSVEGTLKSGSIQFTVSARKTAAGVVSGDFHAFGAVAAAVGTEDIVPFDFKGPVTCLDVESDQVGLYYPLATATPEAIGKTFGGVQITIHGDGHGGKGTIGFVPLQPALAPAVGCSRNGAAPLPVDGGGADVGSPTG